MYVSWLTKHTMAERCSVKQTYTSHSRTRWRLTGKHKCSAQYMYLHFHTPADIPLKLKKNIYRLLSGNVLHKVRNTSECVVKQTLRLVYKG